MTRRTRSALLVVALVVATLLAGCATVPSSSDVTVLRRLGDAAEPTAPPGPVRGAGPLETVRGWVLASGATAERHQAARGYLTSAAAGGWDDGAVPTVVSDQVDTVFADRTVPAGQTAVRVRTTQLGVLTPSGAFVARPGPVDVVVELALQNGQWRISALPPGTIVRSSDLQAATRPVRAWFLDPVGTTPISDLRYLPTSPTRSVAARALQLLLAGPSEALSGAATSALPPDATLRSAVGTTGDGAVTVDLTRVGTLTEPRRRAIAQQVSLTLAGVGVPRVRLLADGAPLLPERPDVTVSSVLGRLPPSLAQRPDLPTDPVAGSPSGPEAPALMASRGRVRALTGEPVGGPAGSGAYQARAASASAADDELAVVAQGASPAAAPQRLLAGSSGTELAPTGIEGRTLARPSWAPDGREVWTVVDGVAVVRAQREEPGGSFAPVPVDAGALAGKGAIGALRLSPDGARIAAVVGGRIVVGALARDGAGGVRVASVVALRPDTLGGMLDVDWTRDDQLVAVGARSDRPVALVSVDGFDLATPPATNLTPPVTAVTADAGRRLVVVDQSGTWTLPTEGADATDVWQSVPGFPPASVPAYPG